MFSKTLSISVSRKVICASASTKSCLVIRRSFRLLAAKTMASLWKLCIKTMDGRQFADAVKGAIEAGVVHKAQMPGENWLLTYKGELKK